jgi:uncharacterized protein YbjT (DUF2867 family)
MSRLITILGGSGFLGRYIARRMAQAGWRVRVATRRPNEAGFVRTYGVVGQVEPVLCNIRDEASLRAAMMGAEAVVNCVGTFDASGKNSFDAIHIDGAGRAARLAAEAGARHFVHISAIGADPESDSDYGRSKAAGEAAVLEAFPDAVILRPSIMFGAEDKFFNRFAGMTRLVALPARCRRQHAVPAGLCGRRGEGRGEGAMGEAAPGIYELGGPDVRSFRELMQGLLAEIRRTRVILPLPWFMARLIAGVFGMLQTVSLGLYKNSQLTRDQVRQLRRDNVVLKGARGFDELDIVPVPMELVLPDYLWRYRPTGQYENSRDAARNLRGQE